jgi:hypothetical protein
LANVTEAQDSNSPRMRAVEVKALCAAFSAFRSQFPKIQLKHYSVFVKKDGRNFDVVFVPDRDPSNPWLAGGGNAYGAELHFIVSRASSKILRVEFSR